MKAIQFSLMHSYKRKKKVRKDGTGTVWICAYQGGKHKYYPSGIFIRPNQWNARHCTIVDHPNATAYNLRLTEKMAEVRNYQVELINEKYGHHVSLQEFDEKYRRTGGQKLTFCGFYEMMLERKDIVASTRQTQRNTLNHFRLSVGDISFSSLNYDTIEQFHQYLLGEEKELTTIDKYHRHIKTYVNLAINKGYLKPGQNPYDSFKYDRGSARPKDFLRLEEIEQLETMDTSRLTKTQVKARDVFLLMCYTGLRFSDAVAMQPRHITQTQKGIHYSALMVKNRRRKKKEISLPLYAFFHFNGEEESRAQRITKHCIKKYQAKPNQAFFRNLNNAKVNEEIKVVAKMAGLDKHLTCHVGRHSFGTNMAVKIPVTMLQVYMGHSKIETTMQYVHMSRKIQDDVMEQIRWN